MISRAQPKARKAPAKGQRAQKAGSGTSPVAGPDDYVTSAWGDEALALATREARLEAGDDGSVGELVDVVAGDEGVLTARFAAEVEGYRGWQWSVTLAVVDPEHPTVSEVVLLPGPEALLAPEWVPWKQRVRSGDLGVGDLLPPAPDDARIVPAYLQSDDPAVEEVAHEVGIGRVRVLSREGRTEAATRWHTGEFGPDDEMAKQAPGHCATCAFYLPLAGSLGLGFGVCGNEFSPADGHVVDVRYGCGAHSESAFRPRAAQSGDTVIDELRLEVHQRAGGESERGDAGAVGDAGGETDGDDVDLGAGVVLLDDAAADLVVDMGDDGPEETDDAAELDEVDEADDTDDTDEVQP